MDIFGTLVAARYYWTSTMQTISQYSATSSILVSLTSWSHIWRHTCVRFWTHIRSRSPSQLDRFLSCQATILICKKSIYWLHFWVTLPSQTSQKRFTVFMHVFRMLQLLE